MAGKIVPALILLFDGLKRAYESRAQEEEEEEEEEDGDDCEEALSSDEDDMDEMAPDYLDKLAEFAKTKGDSAGFEIKAEIKDEDADSDGEAEESVGDLNETGLESFTTPIDDEENETAIDEYWTFKEVITGELICNTILLWLFLYVFLSCLAPQHFPHRTRPGMRSSPPTSPLNRPRRCRRWW